MKIEKSKTAPETVAEPKPVRDEQLEKQSEAGMDEKKQIPRGSLGPRKLPWPPQFSKDNIIEGLRAQQQHLKQHAPSVPTPFPVDEPKE